MVNQESVLICKTKLPYVKLTEAGAHIGDADSASKLLNFVD